MFFLLRKLLLLPLMMFPSLMGCGDDHTALYGVPLYGVQLDCVEKADCTQKYGEGYTCEANLCVPEVVPMYGVQQG